jgi:hypothetical protein
MDAKAILDNNIIPPGIIMAVIGNNFDSNQY